jgi:hypothetical protein
MAIIKDINPGPGWKRVRYHCFDSPPKEVIFSPGEIKTTNFKKNMKDCLEYAKLFKLDYEIPYGTPFEKVYPVVMRNCLTVLNPVTTTVVQYLIKDIDLLNQELYDVSEHGGEGLMIRNPKTGWVAQRSKNLLKMKRFEDDEGIVVGYITGRRTDLGSKLLGKMGALILNYKGKRLELSGFTDYERKLNDIKDPETDDATQWAIENPETECPDWITNGLFPRSAVITFKYRGKSNDGIPQEARYWRKF